MKEVGREMAQVRCAGEANKQAWVAVHSTLGEARWEGTSAHAHCSSWKIEDCHTPRQQGARLHLLSLEEKGSPFHESPHLQVTAQDPQHPDVQRPWAPRGWDTALGGYRGGRATATGDLRMRRYGYPPVRLPLEPRRPVPRPRPLLQDPRRRKEGENWSPERLRGRRASSCGCSWREAKGTAEARGQPDKRPPDAPGGGGGGDAEEGAGAATEAAAEAQSLPNGEREESGRRRASRGRAGCDVRGRGGTGPLAGAGRERREHWATHSAAPGPRLRVYLLKKCCDSSKFGPWVRVPEAGRGLEGGVWGSLVWWD